MDRCTGCCDITEILLKTVLNTSQSTSQKLGIRFWNNFTEVSSDALVAYFCLSPLQKHVRKVVGDFGKKSCVSTGVRKPGNTDASPTAMT